MKITVRYFASIREAIGQGSEAVETADVCSLEGHRPHLLSFSGESR